MRVSFHLDTRLPEPETRNVRSQAEHRCPNRGVSPVESVTQRGLAARANVSHSLLTKVETGSRAASQSFLAACARAMSIPVTHLTGQPFIEEQIEDRLSGPFNDLRTSLENFDLTLDDLPVRPLAEIRPDVRDMVLARRDAQYARILGRAPALIDELVQLSQTLAGRDVEQAHHLLVQLYRSAADVAYALGLVDLVSLLLARMDFSASRCGDPYQVATYRYMRAYSTFTAGRHELGRRIIQTALADIDAEVRAADPIAVCAAGNLRLRASILATRQGDADTARGELAEARHLADVLGREVTGTDLSTGYAGAMSFGATNVAIHAGARCWSHGRSHPRRPDITPALEKPSPALSTPAGTRPTISSATPTGSAYNCEFVAVHAVAIADW